MSAELSWLGNGVILCQFEGEFGTENYAVMEGQLPMMAREAEGRVDVILYLSPGAKLPNLRGILQEIGILGNVMPPNFGIFVGVGSGFLLTNPASMTIARAYLRQYYDSDRVTVAPTLEAAQALIQQHREAS